MNADMEVARARLAPFCSAVIDEHGEEHRLADLDEQACVVEANGVIIAVLAPKTGLHAIEIATKYAREHGVAWSDESVCSIAAWMLGAEDEFDPALWPRGIQRLQESSSASTVI